MKPDAFLFDLDGTLIDTEAAWARAMVDLVNGRGGSATFDELLPNVIGRNWIDIDRALHERYPQLGDTSPMEDAVELRTLYSKYAADPDSMIVRGSVDFFLAASAIAPCAIVSGSPRDDVARAAEMCGISGALAAIVGAEDCEAGKPSPSGYLKAAEMLGAEPSRCVAIEDSGVGVAAAVAAGMKVVALDRNRLVPQSFSGEAWKVKDLSELSLEEFR